MHVAIETYTKLKKAVSVPCKGSTGSCAAKVVIQLINECGDRDQDIILKTDQERAIRFFVEDMCVHPQWICTSSLDEKMQVRIHVQHSVLTCLCEFVSFMMNRMDERVKGKRTEVLELEFKEKYGSTTQAGKRTISMQDGVAQWPFVVLVPVLEATSSSDHVPWSQLVCVCSGMLVPQGQVIWLPQSCNFEGA